LGRVGAPLREERAAVEGEQLLLGEPAHHIGGVRLVHTVAETALEAVGVEERHEQLKVRLMAIVGCGRH
jgi:hypothetical protein